MKIYTAGNPTEAHIVCELLKQQRIAAEVRGDGVFSLKGELPLTDDSDPYIWLMDLSKSELASQVIEEFRSAPITSAEWQCKECNERNEGQFALCWSCGTSAPE
ncbi:hypothetical protein MACH09_17230 [Vibrio sp. MACH09]|uniref:DUF2007 domain-containing protein n=1 Tax=unclassified Vibrio TaxID=2614977 RepID=UPI0014939B54|nr:MULTISPECIES: DUF2007 domain-containing protein [unclassified Vibrio]NOI68054.1 DUF2007 domain-containing protein [Vibrio sp. 99-8-1]GLO61215.1 hypothetical protein MACH09_17230 [Vibrio sp. MACH09]